MKILIVEDEPRIAFTVQMLLKELVQESKIFNPTSHEKTVVLAEFEEHCKEKFDLIILDYYLWRGITGYSLTKIINIYKIPFLSFSSDINCNNKLVELGAIGFLDKKCIFDDSFKKIILPFLSKT